MCPLYSVERNRCTALLYTYTTMKMCIVVCTKEIVQTTPTSLHYNTCGNCGLYKGNCVQHSYAPTLQQMCSLWSVKRKRCTALLHIYTTMKMCIVIGTKETVQTTPTSLHYNKCGHCGLYKGNGLQHSYTPTLQQMWSLWSVERKRCTALLHTYTTTNAVIVVCRKETVCSTPTYLHYNKYGDCGL